MGTRPDRLLVVVSDAAKRSLDAIRAWNVEKFGDEHAHAYIEFVLAKTRNLPSFTRLAGPYANGRITLKSSSDVLAGAPAISWFKR